MNKKSVLRVISAIMSVAVTLSLVAFDSFASENEDTSSSWKDKIDPVVIDKMESTSDKIPVWLWMNDIDENLVETLVFEKTGLSEESLSVENEPISDELAENLSKLSEGTIDTTIVREEFCEYLERTQATRDLEAKRTDEYLKELRNVRKELLDQKNAECFSKLEISSDDLIETNLYAPVYLVYLSKEDILRIVKYDEVTAIYYYDENAVQVSDSNQYTDVMSASRVYEIKNSIGLTGSGIKIGVIDAGSVQPCNEISASRINYVEPLTGTDNDHATLVARVCAGSQGVASDASIYSSSGNLQTCLTNLLASGVSVANCSMGYESRNSSYTPLEIWGEYFCHYNRFCFVISAGNTYSTFLAPKQAYNVITVGGFYNQGTLLTTDDKMYGRPADPNVQSDTDKGSCFIDGNGCKKPDIVAPIPMFDNVTGTSLSAPFVTGVVAMLLQLRPSLKSQPEAVKAIIMASCHHKAKKSNISSDTDEDMEDGITDHQGAGVVNPYMAVAIAGSGFYGFRTMGASSTQESIHFIQPPYNAEKLNVSIGWSRVNPNLNTAGSDVDLDLTLKKGNSIIGTSTVEKSSIEMVYTDAPITTTKYEMLIERVSNDGNEIKYAYAFSVDHFRYQYSSISEGIFALKNRASNLYMTQSNGYAYQSGFSGNSTQRWTFADGKIDGGVTSPYYLGVGSTLTGDYKKAVLGSSTNANIIFELINVNNKRTGYMRFYDTNSSKYLTTNNSSVSNGSLVAWAPLSSNDLTQQWSMEPYAFQKGDANADGIINDSDVTKINYAGVGLTSLYGIEKYLADVDGDGYINSNDALLTQQIVNGIF